MKNFFRIILGMALFMALVSGVFAQNVNRQELEENQASVNFINYEGPHSRIDTVAQIRAIGYDLGRAIRNGAVQAGTQNRYFVIHCAADPEGDRYDADVFGLGVDVGVDHIRNLRLILQGYLEAAYGYSAADAALLARFITIYNAVFRGDWNFYSTRYKSIVTQNLVREKAGLSIRYDEWPGQTLITIPLGTGIPGSLSAIDTSGLTDPDVIDSMRSDEGRGIEDRQDMVDLKQREAEEAARLAALERQRLEEEQRRLQREREEAAAAQRRLEEQQREAQRQQEEARRRQEQARLDEEARRISQEESRQRQQEARQQEQAAQRRQQELAQEQAANEQRRDELAEQEREMERRRQEADEIQRLADQKAQEAENERQQIAQDQQEMIDSGSTAGAVAAAQGGQPPNGLLAAGIVQNNASLGRLYRVDPANGSVIQTSGMNTVNTRTITLSGARIFAIAGINQGNGAVRLVEINNDTLEMLKQGEDDIHPNSLLWANGSNLYAITVVDGKNYMARYDTDLAKQAQSASEVHPYASCIFQGDKVLTQSANGSPILLNGQTLK
ncbi:MAG: hypothetical protein LBB72_05030 [Spirochaetaceae bacterium]|jgi:hypothetical protein|nr:hypothetical protein [Spirochaetaceae bacterium]